MALNNYILNGPTKVIDADDVNPWTSWKNHLDRTNQQRGGVDLYAPVGTPVYAPTPGRMVWWPLDGGAGNSCRFQHDLNPGWSDVFSHLSQYVGYNGQHFEQGQIVAYSGNTGGVVQHLHRHLVDPSSTRRNPWDYFGGAAGPTPGTPTTSPISVDEAKILQQVAQRGNYTGPVDGAMGVNSWKGVQTVLSNKNLYSGPVDGLPGLNTWKGVQNLAKLGGYAGPIDGIPGSNTYSGLVAWLAQGETTPTPTQPPTGIAGVYGIDVGTTQRDFDLQALKNAGFQFAIVKAGGSNWPPTYVAPYYHQLVTRARDAGLLVGHYWMAGGSNPAADAAFFLENLFDYRPGDILALDNEAVDNSIFWSDDWSATFMQAVKNATGYAPFLYTYTALLVSQAWPKTKAVGSKLWVANFVTGVPGEAEIGSSFPTWEIHQYSETGSQNGVPLDLNVAKLSAFAGLTQPPLGLTAPPAGSRPGSGGSTPSPTVSFTVAQSKVLQTLAQRGGYTGPVDGALGVNSWKGVQAALKELSQYDGPADGIPGRNTYIGLQNLAKSAGYDGPIDGVPGVRTISFIQSYLTNTSGGAGGITGGRLRKRSLNYAKPIFWAWLAWLGLRFPV